MAALAVNDGLFAAWLKEVAAKATPQGQGSVTADDIKEAMKKDLVGTWNTLAHWLVGRKESREVSLHCASAGSIGGWGGNTVPGQYVQELCKGIVEIKYFMSGVETKKWWGTTDKPAEIAPLTDAESYARCTVGTVALSQIYGGHCHVDEVIEHLTDKVEGKLRKHSGAIAHLNKCKNIDRTALMLGKTLLQEGIEESAKAERAKEKPENWRIYWPWKHWEHVCNQGKSGEDEAGEAKRKELKKQNAQRMAEFAQLTEKKNNVGGMSIAEVLTNENLKLEPTTLADALNNIIENGSVDTNEIDKVVQELKKVSGEKIAQECIEDSKKTFCDRLKCAKNHWEWTNRQRGKSSNKDFWDNKVKELWDELAGEMKKTNGEAKDGKANGCEGLDNPSDKTACNYLHAGLEALYNGTSSSTAVGDILSTKHPSFRQTMGCLLLHSYAKHMKEKATCLIDEGINKAFQLGETLSKRNTNCTGNGKTCIPCKWADNAQLDNCIVQTAEDQTGTARDKLENIFKKDEGSNISTMLTEINKMETICNRLQCIASHLNSSTGQKQNAQNFWTKTGDVGKLWTELSNAMTNNGNNAGDCGTIEEGSGTATPRQATDPERKACQYLTAGFTKLKSIATPGNTEYPTLHKDRSFVQTVGCFLLHSYAKQMKDKANCLVESGIKKAFETVGQNLNGLKCKWDDGDYDNCKINTTGSTDPTPVKDKLKTVLPPDGDKTVTDTLKEINITESLCDKLQCAAGKWFQKQNQNKQAGSTNNKQTWCGFWKEGVGGALKTMFEQIAQNGADKSKNNTGICKDFGDGNDDSVERRACNHITAGLEHIKNISSGSGNGNDQLLHRAVGCIALNMYATKIRDATESSCPIGEEKINKMFEDWNQKYNNNSCKGSGNNNGCFECKRDANFSGCHLSVSDALVDEKNTNCNDNDKRKNVQTQMNIFLNEDNQPQSQSQSISQVKSTLSTITDITKSPFCTQLQCAAKQYQAKKKNGTPLSSDNFWKEQTGEVHSLWQELADAMKANTNNEDQCNTMDNGTGAPANGRSATEPEKKACNYLHAGLKYLKENSTSNGKILSEDPLLKQTVGCILLKEYAKKMKEDSKCVIDSGLKKAFETAGQNLIGGQCKLDDNYDNCNITTTGSTSPMPVKDKLKEVQPKISTTAKENLPEINEMTTLCDYIRCAGPKWFRNHNPVGNSGAKKDWCDFWDKDGVRPELVKMFEKIDSDGKTTTNGICTTFGDGNEHSVERKACNHITAGLKYIDQVEGTLTGHEVDDKFFKQSMMCAALNLYADRIKNETENVCPIDETRIKQMFNDWNEQNNKNSSPLPRTPCNSANTNECFVCTRQNSDFNNCNLLLDQDLIGTPSQSQNGQNCNDNDENKDVPKKMTKLLQTEPKMDETLMNINEMKSSFCTQVQCAAKKWKSAKNKITNGKASGQSTDVKWSEMETSIKDALTKLLEHMMQPSEQKDVDKYCSDKDAEWYKLGHKESKTNKAACLLFASGLKHIYGRPNGQKKDRFKGPSFEQTMGCLFLKEYSKQLKDLANEKKRGHSWVHPLCDIDKGIKHAFSKSNTIMEESPQCKGTNVPNSCFVCTEEGGYDDCKIGDDKIEDNVKPLLQKEQTHMQQTLENTVCPILLTDLLTPFVPLAPVSIGLSAMAYYLWKYFGPLGRGPRFRRSPAEIPGPSVQEQVLDHVEEAGSHEYRLVKKRKPRSAATRTERSGHANRRAIIEIHFEVLDECQKGDTQLNQKDFLELLVQEFMGSEFMKEEQVPKEEVLMEDVPLERVSIEEVLSSGSGLLV
ncbi:SICAvar, type I [Plasmodium knowlesi strain H]|uniref:SICAvar, type I n=4 Tax=Plasmodium knowlesi TaxID=5850 RepID=A0A5E7X6N3_PLAKH|nr:SICAvar, type I [Plasmodium knowlesi strain H]OTN67597.1 SICAvar type I [Plasmodium knowlesi]CAA9990433.1 SICAvar, type I [Plasmodium knowlesi strain H]SBO19639.1 SICAvar, type I [Plasmodium knowlesi strain H]SBO22555.1 SICAvar, type I [Plasmodium knowlesi strain H]VVS79907.1 SICAvar, type I [Plasmodium knowlesi strain H]